MKAPHHFLYDEGLSLESSAIIKTLNTTFSPTQHYSDFEVCKRPFSTDFIAHFKDVGSYMKFKILPINYFYFSNSDGDNISQDNFSIPAAVKLVCHLAIIFSRPLYLTDKFCKTIFSILPKFFRKIFPPQFM